MAKKRTWVDQDLVHHHGNHHVQRTIQKSRVGTEPIAIDPKVQILQQIAINHRRHQNITVNDGNMIQDHHHLIAIGLAGAAIDGHQAILARLQVVAPVVAVTAIAAAAIHIGHRHLKNGKLSHLQVTWIKFDRYERQHRQN